ncbi:MAG: acylphosphatase [Actinomycetota bacterium]|nr:acylphosphatase [Actinomycetota bacterium]
MRVRRRVRVSGRVQNVGFRAACRAEALRLDVAGYAVNAVDGTVEAAFEGAPEAVAAMLAWCEHGPRGASVRAVEAIAEDALGASGFEIG